MKACLTNGGDGQKDDGVWSLQQELHNAIEKQHIEHRQSIAKLLRTVASLCEDQQCGSKVAEAVRKLPECEDEGTTTDTCTKYENTIQPVGNEIRMKLPPAPTETPETSGPTPSDGAFTSAEEVEGGEEASGESEGSTVEMVDVPVDNGNGDIGMPPGAVDDFKVADLDFIDERGRMIKAPSKLIQILHPALRRQVNRMTNYAERRWQPMKGRFPQVVHSGKFQAAGSLVILANYFFIMAQTDKRISDLNGEETQTMVVIGYFFTMYYLFELICMMVADRSEFFVGSDVGWNMFDFAIVAVAMFEMTMKLAGFTGTNTSFLRVMRFLKISRVLRMFSAVRMFKEIKIMVDALSGCATLFMFCSAMLALFTSVFAIFFVQGFATILEDGSGGFTPSEMLQLQDEFGSVANAILTLYMSVLGGIEWGDTYALVRKAGIVYSYLFIFFITFYYIAFFNVVIGVFCEKAMSLAAVPTTAELRAIRDRKLQTDARDLLSLLHKFKHDAQDESNTISLEVFEVFIRDPEVATYFEVRGIKPSSVHRVFAILCEVYDTSTVDFRTFVSTLVKLDGQASALDLHTLSVRQMHAHHQVKVTHNRNHDQVLIQHEKFEKAHAAIHGSVHSVLNQLPSLQQQEQEELGKLVVVEKEMNELVGAMKHQLDPGGKDLGNKVGSKACISSHSL